MLLSGEVEMFLFAAEDPALAAVLPLIDGVRSSLIFLISGILCVLWSSLHLHPSGEKCADHCQ